MKRFVSLVLALALAAVLPAGVAASPRQEFSLTKVCSVSATTCDITFASAPFEQLEGGRITYFDRVFGENAAGWFFEIARVQVTTGDGSGSAWGQIRWIRDHALFTFGEGSGSLAGLHADGRIDLVDADNGVYGLTGTYHLHPMN